MVSKTWTFMLGMSAFWAGLNIGSYFTPSPETLSDIIFVMMLVVMCGGMVVGFGFMIIDLWEKRKRRVKNETVEAYGV